MQNRKFRHDFGKKALHAFEKPKVKLQRKLKKWVRLCSLNVGRENVVGIANPGEAGFPAPLLADPGVYPAFCALDTGSLSRA